MQHHHGSINAASLNLHNARDTDCRGFKLFGYTGNRGACIKDLWVQCTLKLLSLFKTLIYDHINCDLAMVNGVND